MATATKKKKAKTSAPKSAVEIVKAAAARPDFSRAGVEHTLSSPDCPLSVTTYDGARATFSLDKHDPLDQAGLIAARKLIDQAIGETY